MSATLKLSCYLVRQAACLDGSEAITLDCSPKTLREMALAALAERRHGLRDKLERAEAALEVLAGILQLMDEGADFDTVRGFVVEALRDQEGE